MNISSIIKNLTTKEFDMKQSYIDKIKHYKNKHNSLLDQKASFSSKKYLAAVCFKVSAKSSHFKMGNDIFAPIGYYYSLYHLSISLLALEINCSLIDLRELHHKKLSNMIKANLINQKLISPKYLENLLLLRDLRESTNYQFGYSADLYKTIEDADKIVDDSFSEASKRISDILKLSDTLFRFQVGIGDGFGDDILDTYLSKNDKRTVWNYLVEKELTV